jgi:hypothetical protein
MFDRSLVNLLKDKPRFLLRIAEVHKRYLMGIYHPDLGNKEELATNLNKAVEEIEEDAEGLASDFIRGIGTDDPTMVAYRRMKLENEILTRKVEEAKSQLLLSMKEYNNSRKEESQEDYSVNLRGVELSDDLFVHAGKWFYIRKDTNEIFQLLGFTHPRLQIKKLLVAKCSKDFTDWQSEKKARIRELQDSIVLAESMKGIYLSTLGRGMNIFRHRDDAFDWMFNCLRFDYNSFERVVDPRSKTKKMINKKKVVKKGFPYLLTSGKRVFGLAMMKEMSSVIEMVATEDKGDRVWFFDQRIKACQEQLDRLEVQLNNKEEVTKYDINMVRSHFSNRSDLFGFAFGSISKKLNKFPLELPISNGGKHTKDISSKIEVGSILLTRGNPVRQKGGTETVHISPTGSISQFEYVSILLDEIEREEI